MYKKMKPVCFSPINLPNISLIPRPKDPKRVSPTLVSLFLNS